MYIMKIVTFVYIMRLRIHTWSILLRHNACKSLTRMTIECQARCCPKI
jgi:hypothetical protein